LDDLKARVAANPSAALAIGAGIGWRLLKHPPIATALIGTGLLSLWRTTPVYVDEKDYLTTAQQRLGEQVSEAAETTKDFAAETVGSVQEKASEYAQAVQEKMHGLASSAVEQAAQRLEQAGEAARHLPDQTKTAARRATARLRDENVRDQLLLGVAGLAVAAAETERQVERLERVFDLIDKKAQGKTCDAIIGITDEGAEIMKDYKGSPALDAGLIAAAQAVEHYEISRPQAVPMSVVKKAWPASLRVSNLILSSATPALM
jgi:hypothetical protein